MGFKLKNFCLWLFLFLGVIALSVTFWVRDRYVVPIVTYHHVRPTDNPDLNTVTPAAFDRQMRFLRDNGYHVISFADLVEGVDKGHSFSRNTVVIHFDDGYDNNYTYAFPVLKKYHLPAMVFLVSDLVGTKGYVTWEQVKEMEAGRFLAGVHTRNHAYLPDLSADKKWDEIVGSKRIIEEKLGHPVDFFVYPNGGFDEQSKEFVEKAGFKAAASTNRGREINNQDLFELKRIRIKDTDHGLMLWVKLSGYYNLFRKSKSGY